MDTLTSYFTNIAGNTTSTVSPMVNRFRGFVNGDGLSSKITKVVLMSVLLVILIEIFKKMYFNYKRYAKSSPYLLDGTKNAKKRLVILQDPSKAGSVTLERSVNESGGLEFSYSMWMFIDDWTYKYGKWKHILHKGNATSWPLRAPGLWLHPKKNAMRVYMNTFKNIGEYADINNIPLNKWFHISVCVRQRNMDLFLNGNLVKRQELQGLPKQNDGDIYINSFRGFSGYMSNIKYNDYYLSFSEMDHMNSLGPSTELPNESVSDKPPYLSYNWWANSK